MFSRTVCGLLALSAVLALWIFGQRLHAIHVASTVAPGTAITSGCEEESIFALWRVAHGEDIYISDKAPPYAATYFNWAFYKTYGGLTRPLWKQGNEATAIFWARVLTAGAAIAGAGISAYGMRRLFGENTPSILPVAMALFVFTGPLVGWWIVTLRPDICALVAEATFVWIFLHHQRSRIWVAMLATVAGSYLAWSFKPTYITGLATVSIFLLLKGRLKALAIVGISITSLWAFTLLVGGTGYRNAILDTATNNTFYPALGLSNFLAALKTGLPIVVLAIIALISGKTSSRTPDTSNGSLARDAAQLGLIGTLIATTLMLIASSKLGAAPNYFFPALFMLSLWATGMITQKSWILPGLGFAVLAIVVQLGLALGFWGTLDLTPQTTLLTQRWSVLKLQPEPRFSADLRLNLPWLNPESPPLMPAYNYERDRNRGKIFKGDGVGGMIKSGVFMSLLLPANTTTTYDSATLENFGRGEVSNDYVPYRFK